MSASEPWLNKWAVEKKIGQGGQGEVFRVKSITDGSKIAVLKLLVDRWKDDPKARNRLEQEAKTLKILGNHQAKTPKLFDSSISNPDCDPYVIMEYIPGIRFDEWLARESPSSIEDSLKITCGLADTIKICHNNEIGHRDLKPANIIFKGDIIEDPYVIDFGISFDSRQTLILTNEGEVFWNEFITLPECQISEGGQRDLRSDITALVGVFFTCLTGVSPRVLRNAQDQAPHERNESLVLKIARSRDEGERLLWFFSRGFATRIDARFQSMDEFLDELKSFETANSERDMDALAQFESLNRSIELSDRNVQVGNLNAIYEDIVKKVNNSIQNKLRKLNVSFGLLEISKIKPGALNAQSNLVVQGSDKINKGNVVVYSVTRKHYNTVVFCLMAAVAKGMEIHFYVVGASRLASQSYPDAHITEWTKAAVFDGTKQQLPEVKVEVLAEAVSHQLALEFSRLARSLRKGNAPPESI